MDFHEILHKNADALNLKIVTIHSVNDDLLELTIAHKDSLEHVDLETVAKAASVFAEAIDYEIGLDVSSEGAERVLEESDYGLAIDKYVFIKLKNPSQGFDQFEGYLVSVDDKRISISVRVKHASKKFEIEKENIGLLRLAVKV